ncbi:MAG: MDR/zinc-dependent alcohol dehydrogenase-like family protein [Planctomycetota bacterium]|jgi:threonine dehydrogenase-like Zn-dependent dehydrogenase
MPDTFGYERGKSPTWTLWGAGFDKLTLANRRVPEVGDDQVLARREVCTICFSSVKEILSGNDHPRLGAIDFAKTPVVLGDEAFLVLEKVGRNLRGRFEEGAGYAMEPDYGDGVSAFGYNQDGGLTRYGILDGRVLDFLIPVDAAAVRRVGMYAVSLSEPLACHEKSCTLEYRVQVNDGGRALVIGDGEDGELTTSGPFAPSLVVAVNCGPGVTTFLERAAKSALFRLVRADDATAAALRSEHAPDGWDDIIVASAKPALLRRAAKEFFATLSRGGVMAFVGPVAGSTPIELELGSYHYDDTLLVGTTTGDIHAAYTANTDFTMKKGSTVAYLGAGGPMGQTGILWAAALGENAPGRIIAADIDDQRLSILGRFSQWLPAHTVFETHNTAREELASFVEPHGVDYLMVLAPAVEALEAWLPFMADGAVVNLFAGLRNKWATFDARDICQRRLRLVGHSGLDIPGQKRCLEKILSGRIVTDPVVAAVGGMDAAWDAMWATHMGTFPGKICIYPGARHPLVPVGELTGGEPWSASFEREFLEKNPW